MYKGLYDSFAARWYHGGSVWFYSDPHFGDTTVMSYRGITDEEQIKRINSKIGKNDTIIFLGDIGDVTKINSIRGYKVLIVGNHDAGASLYQGYFDEVYEGALIAGPKLILSHEPVNFEYAFNIHGHIHSNKSDMPGHFNVCAEHINYTPVNLTALLKNGVFKNIANVHRVTINVATKRKGRKSYEVC